MPPKKDIPHQKGMARAVKGTGKGITDDTTTGTEGMGEDMFARPDDDEWKDDTEDAGDNAQKKSASTTTKSDKKRKAEAPKDRQTPMKSMKRDTPDNKAKSSLQNGLSDAQNKTIGGQKMKDEPTKADKKIMDSESIAKQKKKDDAATKAQESKQLVAKIVATAIKRRAADLASQAKAEANFFRASSDICLTRESLALEMSEMRQLEKDLLAKDFPKGCLYLVDLSIYIGSLETLARFVPSEDFMDPDEFKDAAIATILRNDMANVKTLETLNMVHDEAKVEFEEVLAKIEKLNVGKNQPGNGKKTSGAKQQAGNKVGNKIFALRIRGNVFNSVRTLARVYRKKKGYVEPEPEEGASEGAV